MGVRYSPETPRKEAISCEERFRSSADAVGKALEEFFDVDEPFLRNHLRVQALYLRRRTRFKKDDAVRQYLGGRLEYMETGWGSSATAATTSRARSRT